MRTTLDDYDFGPSLLLAVAAGRALAALRDDDDSTLAARLPWSLRNVLRVHVLPHHLTELACAASLHDVAAADEMLDEIPAVAPTSDESPTPQRRRWQLEPGNSSRCAPPLPCTLRTCCRSAHPDSSSTASQSHRRRGPIAPASANSCRCSPSDDTCRAAT